MLYQLHEMNRTLLSPLIQWAEASSKLFTSPVSPLAHSPFFSAYRSRLRVDFPTW
jgi:poly(3-hydroxybutyrate) depolymerase